MKTLRIIRGREAVNYWLGEPFRASQTSHTTGRLANVKTRRIRPLWRYQS